MIFSRDKDFEEALANPDALDKRLEALKMQRKLACGTCIVLVICLFLAIALWMTTARPDGKQPPFAPALLMLAILVIQQMASAVSAQGDIRTLMAFRKLRELRGGH